MKNSRGERLIENTEVRLHKSSGEPIKERRRTARIVGWVDDVPGGVVLSERLAGFLCWNIEALEPARMSDRGESTGANGEKIK